MNTELIRLKKISEAIGLSTATLRRMIKRNELSGVLLGGNYYLSHKDYDELLFNIECKKLNITPDEMRAIYKEVQKSSDGCGTESVRNRILMTSKRQKGDRI